MAAAKVVPAGSVDVGDTVVSPVEFTVTSVTREKGGAGRLIGRPKGNQVDGAWLSFHEGTRLRVKRAS